MLIRLKLCPRTLKSCHVYQVEIKFNKILDYVYTAKIYLQKKFQLQSTNTFTLFKKKLEKMFSEYFFSFSNRLTFFCNTVKRTSSSIIGLLTFFLLLQYFFKGNVDSEKMVKK
jgi:hypothetical protein